MTNPTSLPCDPVAPSTGSKFDARTPPGSDKDLPLTPPASADQHATSHFKADAWIHFLERLQDPTNSKIGTKRFKLLAKHYPLAIEELKRWPSLQSYIEDKVRLDYDPISGYIHARMPTPVHDVFSNLLVHEIKELLRPVAKLDDEDGVFAAKIIPGGSSRIILEITGEEKEGGSSVALRRHPDAQFQHVEAAYPGVVIEISYSQEGKDLEKLAWDYIQHSNGDIKAVIGIDINHGPTKPSTVSLWRPEYTRENGDNVDTLGVRAEIEYEPFRSPTQVSVNSTDVLQLYLIDFATDILTKNVSNRLLCIPFQRLAEFLGTAENVQRKREQVFSGGVKSERIVKKRRRSSSPADRLLPDDESRFLIQEHTAMEKATALDQDFKPAVKRRT
ncbi:hypothetical protein S40288_10065 [Stachybotrys chartarum IBT 40288]|nr:hypothetical protein S40288_10065 [Stachybotrys chartarum IBT 40288]